MSDNDPNTETAGAQDDLAAKLLKGIDGGAGEADNQNKISNKDLAYVFL